MEKTLIYYQIYILIGLISSLILSPFIIKILTKFKAGQIMRKEGPAEHMVKAGTPTMGGIIIIIPVIILTIMLGNFSYETMVISAVVFCFFMIGFVDDMLIVIRGKNDGLSPKLKILFQVITAFLFGLYLYSTGHQTILNIPFTARTIDIGLFYIPFLIFIMTGTSNAINLTDGLDGLAAGTTAITIFPLILLLTFSLNTPLTQAGIIMGLLCIGTCAGYLWFNSYPASVFMGDTGSIALGGLVSTLAIIGHNELWLAFAGFIFVIETLSVIIQVLYYKKTKKRIFLMSPLHHHFEKKGWRETKVSFRFYLLQIIAALITGIGFLMTKLN